MPEREDGGKALEQASFSRGQREIGQQAIDDSRFASSNAPDRDERLSSPRDASFDERIARCAADEKSLAGESLKKDDAGWRVSLDKMDPAARREYREQLTGEVLAKEVFCKAGYERASSDRLDGTRATSWDQLHDPEKLAAFRDAEQLTARIEGREPCPITASESERDGGFNPKTNTIDLDHPKTLAYGNSEERAMLTFFHEQAHAKQRAAVENPDAFPEVSASQREEWRENMENYKPGGEPKREKLEYRDQPIERDARAEASERLARVLHERRRTAEE